MIKKMQSFNNFLEKFEFNIGILALIVMLVASALQVVARYIFKVSIAGTDEIAIFSMMILVYMTAALAVSKNEHISLDLLDVLIKNERKLKVLGIINDVIVLIVVIIFSTWTYDYFSYAVMSGKKSTALLIPYYIPIGATLTGSVLSCYHIIVRLISRFLGKYDSGEAIEKGDM